MRGDAALGATRVRAGVRPLRRSRVLDHETIRGRAHRLSSDQGRSRCSAEALTFQFCPRPLLQGPCGESNGHGRCDAGNAHLVGRRSRPCRPMQPLYDTTDPQFRACSRVSAQRCCARFPRRQAAGSFPGRTRSRPCATCSHASVPQRSVTAATRATDLFRRFLPAIRGEPRGPARCPAARPQGRARCTR
jgi:hypothetical protein